jgi:hypothetical protein
LKNGTVVDFNRILSEIDITDNILWIIANFAEEIDYDLLVTKIYNRENFGKIVNKIF